MSVRLTYGDIRDEFVRGAGSTGAVVDAAWSYISTAQAKLFSVIDLPEDRVEDAEVTLGANEDSVEIPELLYAVDGVIDKETGYRLHREQGGWTGRQRFMVADTGKPPEGTPAWWVRRGFRIYIRDMPTADRVLMVSFKAHPEDADEEMADLYPLSPPQYDRTLVKIALLEWFEINPPESAEGQTDVARMQRLGESIDKDLGRITRSQVEEQRKSESPHMTFWGYNVNP